MAHPRWIYSELVDSAAMLQAYKVWRKKNPEMARELGIHQGLPTVAHSPELGIDAASMEIPCPRGISCKRCREERGGYTFRWFSCLWLEYYEHCRRDYTWLPGDLEGIRATDIRDCSGEIISSCGHLIEGRCELS